jgi:hypothetical protein
MSPKGKVVKFKMGILRHRPHESNVVVVSFATKKSTSFNKLEQILNKTKIIIEE